MEPEAYGRIRRHPKFAELVQQRNNLARTLTVVMLAIYFGFILLVAFAPGFLGAPLAAGVVTTVGIPVGVLVIASTFLLTGIYVAKANTTFDALSQAIVEETR